MPAHIPYPCREWQYLLPRATFENLGTEAFGVTEAAQLMPTLSPAALQAMTFLEDAEYVWDDLSSEYEHPPEDDEGDDAEFREAIAPLHARAAPWTFSRVCCRKRKSQDQQHRLVGLRHLQRSWLQRQLRLQRRRGEQSIQVEDPAVQEGLTTGTMRRNPRARGS